MLFAVVSGGRGTRVLRRGCTVTLLRVGRVYMIWRALVYASCARGVGVEGCSAPR